MKTFLICIFGFVFLSFANAQEKVVPVVDKKLDPLYFHINFQEIISTRKPLFRTARKGEVPELIWKIKTNGSVTSPITMFGTRLLIGTSVGNIYYIHIKKGEVDKIVGAAGGMLAWTGIRNNHSIIGMTWVGTVVSYPIDWPNHMKTSYGGWKSNDVRPLGALYWPDGAIVTRRKEFPVLLELTEGTVVASPSNAWTHGEATAPVIDSGKFVWLATSKSELLAIDQKLTTVVSTIRLPSSYATAMAYENNNLYVLTANKEIFAYDLTTNTQKWNIKVSGNGVDSMVCENGLLYANAGSFYVIDTQKGKVLLEQATLSYENFMRTKPVLTKDRIYTCDSEGHIFIFNKKTIKLNQVINLDEDVMVNFMVDENVLYIATIIGNLYALDVSLY
jgi:outer membrane protein assembly factor BamB